MNNINFCIGQVFQIKPEYKTKNRPSTITIKKLKYQGKHLYFNDGVRPFYYCVSILNDKYVITNNKISQPVKYATLINIFGESISDNWLINNCK